MRMYILLDLLTHAYINKNEIILLPVCVDTFCVFKIVDTFICLFSVPLKCGKLFTCLLSSFIIRLKFDSEASTK